MLERALDQKERPLACPTEAAFRVCPMRGGARPEQAAREAGGGDT